MEKGDLVSVLLSLLFPLWEYTDNFGSLRYKTSCLGLKWEQYCSCSQPTLCLDPCASCFCSEGLPFPPACNTQERPLGLHITSKSGFQPSLLTRLYFPSLPADLADFEIDHWKVGRWQNPGVEREQYVVLSINFTLLVLEFNYIRNMLRWREAFKRLICCFQVSFARKWTINHSLKRTESCYF